MLLICVGAPWSFEAKLIPVQYSANTVNPDQLPDAIDTLLARYSVGARHLTDPAPDDGQLQRMAALALRAPDHAGLVPFRFSVIRGNHRQALGDLFEKAALQAGKSVADAARDRERAVDAPMLVAVIARIDPGHPVAMAHEQWIALGAALGNFMNAAHLMGFAGKMLSGKKVRSAQIVAAFCKPGEALVGWLVMGTASAPGKSKFKKPAAADVLIDWLPTVCS